MHWTLHYKPEYCMFKFQVYCVEDYAGNHGKTEISIKKGDLILVCGECDPDGHNTTDVPRVSKPPNHNYPAWDPSMENYWIGELIQYDPSDYYAKHKVGHFPIKCVQPLDVYHANQEKPRLERMKKREEEKEREEEEDDDDDDDDEEEEDDAEAEEAKRKAEEEAAQQKAEAKAKAEEEEAARQKAEEEAKAKAEEEAQFEMSVPRYTAEMILEAEPVYADYAENHRESIQERRQKKHSCVGWLDRFYLPNIPYDDIAANKIEDTGLDLFEYKLSNTQVNRLREALTTNTTLPWVEFDWLSLTSTQKTVLLNLKHPMILENFLIHKYDERPFPKACAKGNLEDVKLMVEHVTTIDINESTSREGKTGAYIAAFNGKGNVVKYLLGKGANEQDIVEGKMKRKYDERPFPKACAKGNLEDVKLMVEHVTTIDINESTSREGKTGAYLAALNGNDNVVKYLLGKGANEQDVLKGSNDAKVKKIVGEEEMKKILQGNKFTGNLYLSNKSITDEGCRTIAPALRTMPNLKRLYLHYNNIGDEGLAIVSNVLPDMPLLEYLYLSGNGYGNVGCQCLLELVENDSLQSLISLHLNKNYNISSELKDKFKRVWSEKGKYSSNLHF